MDITQPLYVYYGRDRKINLHIRHFTKSDGTYETKCSNENRRLINWVRKTFPHVMNELRDMPTMYNKCGGYYRADRFCFYGMTRAEYILLKLSWSFKEFRVNGRKPTSYIYTKKYVAPYYQKPTTACKVRFSKLNYKPKPLKITN